MKRLFSGFTSGIFLLLLAAPHAYGVLGEKAVGARAALGASYTVRETAHGATRIREYASSEGTIFAVTWRGLGHPDLTPYLGQYYSEYEAANRNAAAGKMRRTSRVSHSSVRTGSLVVNRSGHLRSARGIAYVPALLPKGVEPSELQ
jgi:hypothetical protein